MSLNLNWFKRYDTKCKYFHFLFLFFAILQEKFICVFVFYTFWVITFVPITIYICQAPQNDRLNLSFVKDEDIVGKNIARNCHKTAIY